MIYFFCSKLLYLFCALAKSQAHLVFALDLHVSKNQMCLNVRSAFYTDR